MPIVTQPPSIIGDHHPLEPQPLSSPLPPSTCGRTSRMTRGRKKDLTIPPTRALVQQRDYRARRARYVSDLEERVRKAEEENEKLRHELAAARSGQAAAAPLTLDPQTAHASSELMHNLSVASASLARFHQLVFSEHHHSSQDSRLSGPTSYPFSQHPANTVKIPRPASFPSPAPSPPNAYSIMEPSSSRIHPLRRKRLYREDSPESVVSPMEEHDRRSESRDSSPCCGGIMDCRELIERVDSGATDDLDLARPRTRQHADSPDYPHTMRYDIRHIP
ncbi:hypothetical protein C0995_016036 [Termitomyces sp. Mi166|nr:hypothetical protein C0995_016036 [Termitomyces sp. Mi166\